VNSLNYKLLPEYVEYAAREFSGLFYCELRFIKVAGRVRKQPKLVPELKEVAPFLTKALRRAEKPGLNCVADGFPLCFMKGVEQYSRKARHLLAGNHLWLSANRSATCSTCASSSIRTGSLPEYIALKGESGFNPASKGAAWHEELVKAH
jgi:hypothetical protein